MFFSTELSLKSRFKRGALAYAVLKHYVFAGNPQVGVDILRCFSYSRASFCLIGLIFNNRRRTLVQIIVRENNVDQALKALKKKMQREGTFREMKRRNHFEKPSEKRAREQAEAVRRTRKLQRKRAQREGLISIR